MSSTRRLDGVTAVALCAASVVYLVSLPHNLGFADESYFLYEAKRIRDGEIMYRDIFQYVTPLSSYLMAGLYFLFGTTMTTARATMGVIHGLIALLTYATARALGVRSGLAAAAGMAHIAIGQPAWPFASWHWFSSCVASVVLWFLLRGSGAGTARSAFGLGALCGLFLGVQQQRGLIPTVSIGMLLLVEPLTDAWYGSVPSWRSSATKMAMFLSGILTILVPLLAIFVALAGFEPVYHALVRFPLENYRASAPYVSWGLVTGLSAAYAAATFPRFLALVPLVLVVPLARMLAALIRRRERALVRQCTTLVLFAGASILSIWYNNDFIHIAFIAAPFLVCVALVTQWVLDVLPLRMFAAQRVGAMLALGVAAGLTLHLGSNFRALWARYPYGHETAFGHLDFLSAYDLRLIDTLRARLQRSPSQEIFCYANLAFPYLAAGGKNPTPFQHFSATVFPPRDVARVVATLEQRRVPYLVVVLIALRPGDPIVQLIERDYRLVALPQLAGERTPALFLYERKNL